MRMIKIMKRGPDKVLANHSFHACSRGQDQQTKIISLWFQETQNDESIYRVEMDRGEANRLRDFLNTMLPEAESGSDLNSEITSEMVDRLAWKDGEYHYCVSLCRSAGTVAVPPKSVVSYLQLQSASALEAKEISIATVLWGAAKILEDSPGAFTKAFTWLVEQREKIAAGS